MLPEAICRRPVATGDAIITGSFGGSGVVAVESPPNQFLQTGHSRLQKWNSEMAFSDWVCLESRASQIARGSIKNDGFLIFVAGLAPCARRWG